MAGGQLAGGGIGPGEPCPKCGYARAASDANPAWQRPKCLVAVNLLSGAFAIYFSLSPRDLAIVYWLQSIFGSSQPMDAAARVIEHHELRRHPLDA